MKPAKVSSEVAKATETLAEKHRKLLKRQAQVIGVLTGTAARSANLQAKTVAAKAGRVAAKKTVSKASVQKLAKSVGIWTDSGKLTSSYKK